jgi:hypothetical protein
MFNLQLTIFCNPSITRTQLTRAFHFYTAMICSRNKNPLPDEIRFSKMPCQEHPV